MSARQWRDQLDEFEEAIEALKVAYERYFRGIDNMPPRRAHDGLQRLQRQLTGRRMPTTALRFRMQTLRARLVTYSHYWTRILNQIEKGTYKRVLAESKRREREAAKREAESNQGSVTVRPMTMATTPSRIAAQFTIFTQPCSTCSGWITNA